MADGDSDADADSDGDGDGDSDGDTDADADGDGDADGDADADGDGDADVDDPFAYCDGDLGIVGGTCRNDRNCELDTGAGRILFVCITNDEGYPDGYCAGLPTAEEPRFCEPGDELPCLSSHRGVCLENADGTSSCLRGCRPDVDGAEHCGCRDGYVCRGIDREIAGHALGICEPG